MRALYVFVLLIGILVCGCGGGGSANSFGQPGIYLVDQGNNRIVWLSDMDATFFSRFETAISGVGAVVNGSVDHSGRIYLVDGANDSIHRYDNLAADGAVEFGSHGSGIGQFLNPVRIAVDYSGRMYVVDRDRNKLIRMDSSGGNWTELDLSTWFSSGDEPDLVINVGGQIFMGGGSQIVRLVGMTAVGAVTYGASGTGVGEFGSITGIALDDAGKIYIADGDNDRIVRIDNMTGAGWASFGASGSGNGEFNIPFGIGVDHDEKIYIGDRNNHRLVRIDDMNGTNFTVLNGVPPNSFSFPLSVFPHTPTF